MVRALKSRRLAPKIANLNEELMKTTGPIILVAKMIADL